MIKKKKKVKWLVKHIYPNGYRRSGVISDNPIKCDVIAFEYTYTESKTGKKMIAYRDMRFAEALTTIDILARAVSNFK